MGAAAMMTLGVPLIITVALGLTSVVKISDWPSTILLTFPVCPPVVTVEGTTAGARSWVCGEETCP